MWQKRMQKTAWASKLITSFRLGLGSPLALKQRKRTWGTFRLCHIEYEEARVVEWGRRLCLYVMSLKACSEYVNENRTELPMFVWDWRNRNWAVICIYYIVGDMHGAGVKVCLWNVNKFGPTDCWSFCLGEPTVLLFSLKKDAWRG